ncbi:hypothetical protein [Bradyrhizobium sp. AUGA SZCCT0222]|uniref:hypothetical protein n=1 Tax=Bradyrhizobium sp. AUGA SZCCT0222 TaxID=2807668 RepID=UPI00201239EC|nr:hypothetical protein [Bradyrhizobium sp. AUGA SZCCT0222]
MATFTQMASGNWRVQVRRKTRYVAETFRRHKDGEEWALEMERNSDRNGSSKPRVARSVRTFGDLIDLHDEDARVGKPPRRSKAAVMASLKDRARQREAARAQSRSALGLVMHNAPSKRVASLKFLGTINFAVICASFKRGLSKNAAPPPVDDGLSRSQN